MLTLVEVHILWLAEKFAQGYQKDWCWNFHPCFFSQPWVFSSSLPRLLSCPCFHFCPPLVIFIKPLVFHFYPPLTNIQPMVFSFSLPCPWFSLQKDKGKRENPGLDETSKTRFYKLPAARFSHLEKEKKRLKI